MLGKVAIHLKGDFDFGGIHRPGIVGLVDEVLISVEGHGNESGLVAAALKFPRKMVPDVACRYWTRNSCGTPGGACRVPDVPHSAVSNVALCAKNELLCTVGLVSIKFPCLRKLWGGEIEIH